MTGWVIVVDQPKDFPNADTPHKVITTSEYLARPRLFESGRPKLINLSRSYAYQSKGYYASLLAEARGHRVVPDRRDHAGAARGQALRARPAGARGPAQPLRPPHRLPARGRIQAAGLLRHRPRPALRSVRPAAVRLVPLPGAGGEHRHRRRLVHHRPHPHAHAHAARQRRGDVPARGRCTAIPRGNGATPRRAPCRNTISRCSTIPTRSCRRPRRRPSSISPASPRSCPSTSSRSPGGNSPSLPNMTGCSSARPPRSTTTPTASPAAPGRRACR